MQYKRLTFEVKNKVCYILSSKAKRMKTAHEYQNPSLSQKNGTDRTQLYNRYNYRWKNMNMNHLEKKETQ